MLRILCLFVGSLLLQNCVAQKKYTTAKTAAGKARTTYERGMRMSFNGQAEEAISDFEKTLQLDPNFIDAQMEWANLKYQQKKLAEAETGYENAVKIDPAYDVNVLFSLALVEYDQQKLEESIAHFQQFLKSSKIDAKRKIKAEKYLANISFVAEALKHPVPFEPKNLGANINTADHEYLPTFTADAEKLIYTAVRGGGEDFYQSKKVNGERQKGTPIEGINTDYNEGAQSISADGKLLVFTICDKPGGLGRCDLYFTEFKSGKWTPVKNMGAPVNSSAYESLPSLSADGKTLIFTSDRKGGQGNLDLWVSRRQPDGKWSQPQNLSNVINTSEHEQAPFFHPDGQTLYFMSKGHPGMGEYDLFFSRKQADGAWSKPQNLGYPINTEGNEGAFSVSLDGKTAYFASDMKGGFGKNDIYSFDLYEAARPQPVNYVKALVSDAVSKQKIAAKVDFIDLATGQVFASSITEIDGEFLVVLPAGKDYALHVSKEKYLFYSENFALAQTGTFEKPYLLDISLMPISGAGGGAAVSKPVVLKNVFFETGSAALKKESMSELERLKNLLAENPSLHIQINGHTDDVGSDANNLTLSGNRAKAVFDYLTANGIEANRLRFKGFGESTPLAPNDLEEGRQQNRRTEFVIID